VGNTDGMKSTDEYGMRGEELRWLLDSDLLGKLPIAARKLSTAASDSKTSKTKKPFGPSPAV
jgi:hypothetical protein